MGQPKEKPPAAVEPKFKFPPELEAEYLETAHLPDLGPFTAEQIALWLETGEEPWRESSS